MCAMEASFFLRHTFGLVFFFFKLERVRNAVMEGQKENGNGNVYKDS